MLKNKYFIFIFLIISFNAIRSFHFSEALNFSFDQGNGFTRVLEMWKNKEITLVGPASSVSADNKQYSNLRPSWKIRPNRFFLYFCWI